MIIFDHYHCTENFINYTKTQFHKNKILSYSYLTTLCKETADRFILSIKTGLPKGNVIRVALVQITMMPFLLKDIKD